VLDADGLNALAGHLEVLKRARGKLLLTPHPGEMARLLSQPEGASLTTAEVQKNRISIARAFAKDHGVILALKGARTLIAREDGTVFINPTGNAGMATGGTGDVLAGLCGALIAQGLSTEDAAVAGVWAHGLAGDLAKERRGELGLIASDLLDGLGEVWRRWGR
jgi:NAD(P)H-hydrate epimerase